MAPWGLSEALRGAPQLGWDSPAVAGFLLVAAIAVYLLTRESRLDMAKVPGPWRKALPLVGNLLDLITPDHHRQLVTWANEFGGIYRLKMPFEDVLIVTEPQAVADIMGRGDRSLDKSQAAYGHVSQMVSAQGHPNLLTSASDEKWKKVRKAVAVSFSMRHIRPKFGIVLERVNDMVKKLGEGAETGQSIDMDRAALRVTLDVIGLAAFGHDFECVKQGVPNRDHLLRVLPRCFTEVELRMMNPFRAVKALPRMLFRNGDKGKKSFDRFQAEMTRLLEEMKARGPPAEDDFSIGAQLLRLEKEGGVSTERILSEIGILFVEGFETTGHTISWTLFCLATNPGAQERVAEELDAAGLLSNPGQTARELEFQDLNKLTYLACCIKEAMRMYPVVSVANARITGKPTCVGPYTIPAGVLTAVPLYALHNTKHNWSNAGQFMPERWHDVPTETYTYNSKRNDGAAGITFMPFNHGPRNCVGQSLAKMEVVTVLAKLLGSFQFRLAPEMGGVEGITRRESTHLTLQTVGTQGIRMILTRRGQLQTEFHVA
ncbi:unnamed protein product [Ostreobium quekettii]|uniref:Cytochrome P450 n=1 Tax=Ostreobium quekettii TaxID=121088 RepID=A0A8S1ILB6_9CHLO|nr:unnamed protein product [Ostreobium quekettii]|eukprot:evm.model.scf_24.7 EVM.evm.TU.scf_24.7   scf_24:91427-96938(+)